MTSTIGNDGCAGALLFFFKQKTAYEMRISDWSSDVCSSDLPAKTAVQLRRRGDGTGGIIGWLASIVMRTDAQQGIILNVVVGIVGAFLGSFQIGRASCRARVCQYV